jgi:hypothetical protein
MTPRNLERRLRIRREQSGEKLERIKDKSGQIVDGEKGQHEKGKRKKEERGKDACQAG